jgi:predicted small lipoprotein YifL
MKKITQLIVLGFLLVGLSACGRMGELEVPQAEPQMAQPHIYQPALQQIEPASQTEYYAPRYTAYQEPMSVQETLAIDTSAPVVNPYSYLYETNTPVVQPTSIPAPIAIDESTSEVVTPYQYEVNTSVAQPYNASTFNVVAPELDILPYSSK